MPSRDALSEFLEEIRARWPLARGSLCQVARPCVRPGCAACARGDRHPAHIFSFRRGVRQRCLYVPRDLVPALAQAIASGKWLERRLVEIGEAMVLAHRRQREERAEAGASHRGRRRRGGRPSSQEG